MRITLKARDEFRLGVLRMLNAALGNKEIEKHAVCVHAGMSPEPLTNDECCEIFQKEYKQRKESALAYEQGKRKDLQEIELKEAEIVAEYLPQQFSEDEIKERVRVAISSSGANGAAGVGTVMGILSKELKGRADMGTVSRIVNQLLCS
ncbi:MAG: GatB/Yqey domain protein [Parcubacteria group bacterium GW2011_GWA2_46_7]|nr:MAG: GatB/Yqey domain protein [Parcubacteria group bacterium GW2011_GWF1_45_5]KKU43790.1 MAG: GatB/Yqey domain protein [Parcubacteria group bacterium GW2011_GWA2_46_7]